jgi:carbamoyl-phosphate synthase large subunit
MRLNVVVTSAGTASAISVIKALRAQQEVPVKITAVDADRLAPGLYLADRHGIVPACSDRGYLDRLLELCQKWQIDALYPIFSGEIEVVARAAPRFLERGIGVLLPGADVIELCNDKRAMYPVAREMGIDVPRFVRRDGPRTYPLYAKPNRGSGAKGAIRIDDESDWIYAIAKFPTFLFQEYVEGPEYTVDALFDRQSRLLVASPRLRLAVKAGQSVKGITVHDPELVSICAALGGRIRMVGPCNMQFIRRSSRFVFIEVNPRYAAGGLMLTVRAGANLPLLALKLMSGSPVPEPPIPASGVVMLRYWEEVFTTKDGAP